MADDWQPELDELRRRETFAERLGGAEPVKRQHDEGRLTIRGRIARLVDPDTFYLRVSALSVAGMNGVCRGPRQRGGVGRDPG
ncbi:MAG: hypothetical protein HYY95_09290 [Candidatus Rokubacteria bacterium]|nr:hypothetical protein [Candidatus Rokubacteria bacterium]